MTNIPGESTADLIDWEEDTSEVEFELPKPTGWRILLQPFSVRKKTKGGIQIPEEIRERESLAIVFCRVLELGPLAYKRDDMQERGMALPNPWCKEGDVVLIGKYAGLRLRFKGMNFRIVNDDEVLAVIPLDD